MVLDKLRTLGVVLNVERGTVLAKVFYLSLSHFFRIHIGLSVEVSKQVSGISISFPLSTQDKYLQHKREAN